MDRSTTAQFDAQGEWTGPAPFTIPSRTATERSVGIRVDGDTDSDPDDNYSYNREAAGASTSQRSSALSAHLKFLSSPEPASPFVPPSMAQHRPHQPVGGGAPHRAAGAAGGRTMGPSTLLGEVLHDPLFQLVSTGAPSQRGGRRPGEDSLLSSPVFAALPDGAAPPPFLAPTAAFPPAAAFSPPRLSFAAARDAGEARPLMLRARPSTGAVQPFSALQLPSRQLPPPSMLLVALADMDELQRSFHAHTCVWPARQQIVDFKKIVAATMRAELSSSSTDAAAAAAQAVPEAKAGGTTRSSAAAGTTATAATTTSALFSAATRTAADGENAGGAERESRAKAAAAQAAAGAREAHDAAVRAALHSAHGFLFGTESVPTGIPKVYLQRARAKWVAQYGAAHVQPRLEQAQRHRYEEWRRLQAQQHRPPQQPRKPQRGPAAAHGSPFAAGERVQRKLSSSLESLVEVPAMTCAAAQPSYWRSSSVHATAAMAASGQAQAAAAAAAMSAAARHRGYLPASTSADAAAMGGHGAAAAAVAEAKPMRAAWEMDLFDDLRLVVTAQLSYSTAQQTSSRSAVEVSDASSASALPSSSHVGEQEAAGYPAAMATQLLRCPADLTQMQLPLPVFVYVMSRYLFLAHYAPCFPVGLFSNGLINPFYFPEAAQCTAAYALRTAPTILREAEEVYAEYAVQLRDAQSCFPERAPFLEISLRPRDHRHLWELLCPPQEQDRIGRWEPVPWGHLTAEEEEALLDRQYAAPSQRSDAAATTATAEAANATAARVGGASRPLLSYAYARTARRTHRDRLQQLAQHPVILAEVQRLLAVCESVAMAFFLGVDSEQRGCITWESFTNALIEEADIQDHQLKVREYAAQLTRASASVFDRYVVEPMTPALITLGYTGAVCAVRHSASLVMVEGNADYAVCDGAQLGSIHQRFLVRPVEVILRELEAVPRDAFGRPLRRSLAGNDSEEDDDDGGGGGGHGAAPSAGYDAALRLHPWRNSQQPVRAFVRYEDGRRLQEVTALSVLQQLTTGGPGEDGGDGAAASAADPSSGSGVRPTPPRMHQTPKAVTLQDVMSVHGVSAYVPWPVFVVRSNDMLVRLYSSNRAVQALPEAGLLRCAETVTCMEWAAGGICGRARQAEAARSTEGDHPPSQQQQQQQRRPGSGVGASLATAAASVEPRAAAVLRQAVQLQEYMLLGTRSGMLLLIDLYAVLHRVPRLTTTPVSAPGGGGDAVAAAGAAAGSGRSTSERIGSARNAWSGYQALAQRTFYSDVDPFIVHRRQVHTRGTVVSSIVAAAPNGLFITSGLDGDVYTMRLGAVAAAGSGGLAAPLASTMRSTGSAGRRRGRDVVGARERPLVCLEVLHRLSVCESGVQHALPIPSLSMLAVQTVENRVFLYHTSVLPTATPLATDSGRVGSGAATRKSAATSSSPAGASRGEGGEGAEGQREQHERNKGIAAGKDERSHTEASAIANSNSTGASSRLELYDAAAPHLGSMVAIIAVEELDQLLTVDSTGYVKVWSLRQSQPLTSFYALVPVQRTDPRDGAAAQGDTGGGPSTTAAASGLSAAAAGSGGGGAAASGTSGGPASSPAAEAENKNSQAALLRVTRHTIEAAVEAADSRLQPCISVAYNYAGRQLYVMGSNNAALCFFMSGQSSARAHTNPLRALLVDTASRGSGPVHRRLISLSTADCRIWSLVTGAMELGVRASNHEYRQLFDHRITGRPETAAQKRVARKDGGEGRPATGGGGNGGGNGGAMSARRLFAAEDNLAELGVSASTTGEPRRRLPRSVADVMRAVAVRAGSAGGRRAGTASGSRDRSAYASRAASCGGRPPSSLSQPRTAVAASGGHSHGEGGEDGEANVPGALRDHNILTSEIRCACLGPEGQWIGYALLHGEIRLHRSDSGRLLHTFITTPPSLAELVQAALRYEYLFIAAAASASPQAQAAPPAHPRGGLSPSLTPSAAPPPPLGAAGGGVPAVKAASHDGPKGRVTTTAFARAVAAVLQRLVTSVSTRQRFGAVAASTSATAAAVEAASMLGGGGGGGERDVHKEPLSMFYVEAAQELQVAYADGLVRVFTLLGHRTTAARVIVSRTLVTRALEQVRRVLQQQSLSSPLPGTSTARASLQQLFLEYMDGGEEGHRHGTGAADAAARSPTRRRASSLLADASAPLHEREERGTGSVVGATATSPSSPLQVEPDVVLLATASPPLGLVCLVHASGLVTVMDVQATSEASQGSLDGGRGGTAGSLGATLTESSSLLGSTGAAGFGENSGGRSNAGEASSSTSPAAALCQGQAGVVVHSFSTTDEVTAATFLGAYPCLALADRRRQLSFHMVKGATLLALVGDFAERLHGDLRMRVPGGGGGAVAGLWSSSSPPLSSSPNPSPSPNASSTTSTSPSSSPTEMWSVSIDETCASVHAVGIVTTLAFDPLYATLYVGTSQGYVLSYLVRRLLLAYQLTPVFLRGVDGVAATTYAAELQRVCCANSTDAVGGGGGGGGTSSSVDETEETAKQRNFLLNVLNVLFSIPPSRVVVAASAQQDGGDASDDKYNGGSQAEHAAVKGRHPESGATTTAPAAAAEGGAHRAVERDGDEAAHAAVTRVTAAPLAAGSGSFLSRFYGTHASLFLRPASSSPASRRRDGTSVTSTAAAATQPSSTTTSATLPPLLNAFARSPSNLLLASAVLHDALTQLYAVTAAAGASPSAAAAPSLQESTAVPWWECAAGGGLIKEFVARQCGAPAEAGYVSLGDETLQRPTIAAPGSALELDAAAAELLRAWVSAAVCVPRTTTTTSRGGCGSGNMQGKASQPFLAATAPPAAGRDIPATDTPHARAAAARRSRGNSLLDSTDDGLYNNNSSCSSSRSSVGNVTLPPSSSAAAAAAASSSAPPPHSIASRSAAPGHSALRLTAPPDLPEDAEETAAGGLFSFAPPPPPSTAVSPRAIADALVQEVEEELLFGDTATALHDTQRRHSTSAFSPSRDVSARTIAGRESSAVAASQTATAAAVGHDQPHPITELWVEPLFTRQAIAMASRSPVCLLTPPGMLERARRERLDRMARSHTAAAGDTPAEYSSHNNSRSGGVGTGARGSSHLEWDSYVEGAPPDYLADMLSRPGQVLPEAERQALRQRGITALQCRRNGYLCIGHADGSVSLWTPYACGRLEGLCPSTSLPTSLDRLEKSVRAQFRYVHARVVVERQRLAFEGAMRSAGRSEQEGKTHMKERIRKLLLEHHLAQLYQDKHLPPLAKPGTEAHAAGQADAAGPALGSLEAPLMAMRPLMCLLLGIGSPAELQARQLSLEDLCFLPLQMESIASIDAFQAENYAAAVTVAMQRLRRELLDEHDEAGTLRRTVVPDMTDTTRRRHSSRRSTRANSVSAALSRSISLSTAPATRARRLSALHECTSVYEVNLSSLARELCAPPHVRLSPGLRAFPGAVRLLLHRALDGAPGAAAGGGHSARPSLSHAHAAAGARLAVLPSAAAMTTTAPAEGEFFELCHGLQVAEAHAEAQWSVAEVHRLWDCLGNAAGQPRDMSSDSGKGSRDAVSASRTLYTSGCVAGNSGLGDRTRSHAATSAAGTADLPPNSAAAASAAVRRQVQRELEGRLAALSQRCPALAALRHTHCVLRPGPTSAARVVVSRSPAAQDRRAAVDSLSAAVPCAALTQGSGIVWVQAVLREQARHAFPQPRVVLPASHDETEPAQVGPTPQSVRAPVDGGGPRRRGPPTSVAAAAASTVLPPSAASLASTVCRDSTASTPAKGGESVLSAPQPPVGVVAEVRPLPPHTPSSPPQQQTAPGEIAAGPPADTAAVFLTEMDGKAAEALQSRLPVFGHDAEGRGRAGQSPKSEQPLPQPSPSLSASSPPLHFVAAGSPRSLSGRVPARAAGERSPWAAPPATRAVSARPVARPQGGGRSSLPLVPLHRTKLARTGSSRPTRPQEPAAFVSQIGAAAAARRLVAEDGERRAADSCVAASHSPLSSSPLRRPPAQSLRLPAPQSASRAAPMQQPYTCYSLLSKLGTTKQLSGDR